MITGFIINIFYQFLAFIIGFLPTGDLGIPTEFTDGLNLIVQYLHAWSWLLPVDQLLAAVITVIGFYAILMGVRITLWIIRTVRGSGS